MQRFAAATMLKVSAYIFIPHPEHEIFAFEVDLGDSGPERMCHYYFFQLFLLAEG